MNIIQKEINNAAHKCYNLSDSDITQIERFIEEQSDYIARNF
jgi:hypothetical protein